MQHDAAIFSVSDVPSDGKSYESWAFEQGCSFGRRLLREVVRELDDQFYEGRPDGWISKGFEERTVETAVGTLTYRRRIYVNRSSGERIAPVDEYLGWSKSALISPEVKALCAELACGKSFREASRILERLRGIKVSAEAVHQATQDYGSARGEQVDSMIQEMYEDPGSCEGTRVCTLFLEIDSTFTRQQRSKKRSIEVKLGVVHEGWNAADPSKKRFELVNKQVVIDCGDVEEFWDRLTAQLSKHYDLSKCRIIINGDGAEWIRKGAEYFPNAEFQLDKFHWLRFLRRAVGFDEKALRALRDKLENEDWDAVDQIVNDLLERYPDRREAILGFWRYVSSHKGEIQDYRKRIEVELELTRGLGAAESNIDTVLVERFKGRRRSWSKRGVQNLGNLVELKHNGKICEWLQQHRDVREESIRQKRESGTETGQEKTTPHRGSTAFSDWARVSVPCLRASTRPTTIALRGLLNAHGFWTAPSLPPRSA